MQKESSLVAHRRTKSVRRKFLKDVLHGLREQPKFLQCKYFYDQTGSRLFDEICQLDEYYLTRTELAIMRASAGEMVAQFPRDVLLIEYGSGSSIKTRLLLEKLAPAATYVPVDISRKHLESSAARLAGRYPHIEILPVAADFTADFELPQLSREPAQTVVYFPGSTVGNFERKESITLLERIAGVCGPGGGLLIGIDLKKDVPTIEAAYNDAKGVTARFNLNILRRINRELEADFQLDQFEHRAVYDSRQGRVELGLVSRRRQSVKIAGNLFHFDQGEKIHTEYSHKYTVDEFSAMAGLAGFSLSRYWTDAARRFAVLYLLQAT